MPENNLLDSKFLSSLSTGQSLESLITAPLTAVSKANAMMLSGQAQFIIDQCFKKHNGIYSPVLIKMEYTAARGKKEYFYIPLLTLLPMNTLAVDKVDVKFNVEVTSTVSHESQKKVSDNDAKPRIIQKKAKIGAKIGSSEKSGSTAGGIAVSIKAKQIPLTKGITTIIDLYSKNIITSSEKNNDTIEHNNLSGMQTDYNL